MAFPITGMRLRNSLSAARCFHCGGELPLEGQLGIVSEGALRPVCCRGCEAVASAILAQGLGDFYRIRDGIELPLGGFRPDEERTAGTEELSGYDDPQVQLAVARDCEGGREILLRIEGIRCAACVWLNEQALSRLPGVVSVQVNYVTRRARVVWDPARIALSRILGTVRSLGYQAHPFDPSRVNKPGLGERRRAQWRLFVSGFGMMQVMMYAVPAYFAGEGEMSDDISQLLRWAGLLLTMPVVLFAAEPFFRGAWRNLVAGRLGMDAPVAFGIAVAFVASAGSTLSGAGPVYFDSIAMFVFLLLGGRYLELLARQKAGESLDYLGRCKLEFATRLTDGPQNRAMERVPISALRRGDTVLVAPGEAIPADGVVVEGRSAVDESLLTGQGEPLAKREGSRVFGGSLNARQALTIRVEKVGADSLLATIARLAERASGEKPPSVELAGKVTGWFVLSVLLLAVAAGAWWMMNRPEAAVLVVVSVLVATCPCAFSLAMPTALTVATGALARRGLVVTRGHTIETLARASDVVFDKTGTLTQGEPSLAAVRIFGQEPIEHCLAIGSALEAGSTHPLARALRAAAPDAPAAERARIFAGAGIDGWVEGRRYRLGKSAFALELCADSGEFSSEEHVLLTDAKHALASFSFDDAPRPGARRAVDALRKIGLRVHLLTGDAPRRAQAAAAGLGIDSVRAGARPEDKLAFVRELQGAGATVLMVGDGVNDAPVLARADVSLAMGTGADLAQLRADAVLLSSSLEELVAAVKHARRTLSVMRQNVAWAFAYNLVVLPLAVIGEVAPWAAAIGMSASSLLVVLNALRLRDRTEADAALVTDERIREAVA